MNRKDQWEMAYWTKADMAEHLRKLRLYLAVWDYQPAASVLDVGCGPLGGFLPMIDAAVKVGVDPLIEEYRRARIFGGDDAEAQYFSCRLEEFQTAKKFDAVLCADALDHGDLGFHCIPKLAGFLNPGGRLYLHVHLRPKALLNVGHDHQLKEDDLDKNLENLVEVKRKIYPQDVDGEFCAALVGVWQSPL
jgi:SAM-dependent methyltransferase